MDQLTTILDEDGAEELFKQVLKDFDSEILGEEQIEYRCSCSRESVSNALRSIGKDELEKMIKEGNEVSVGCQFCDENYVFTIPELQELLP